MLSDAQIEQVAPGAVVRWSGPRPVNDGTALRLGGPWWGIVEVREGPHCAVRWPTGDVTGHPVTESGFVDLIADPEGSLAFIDCETLGLDPEAHPVWEWAVIVDGTEHLWQQRLPLRPLPAASDDPWWVAHADVAPGDSEYGLPIDDDPRCSCPVVTSWSLAHGLGRYNHRRALYRSASAERLSTLLTDRWLVGINPAFDATRAEALVTAEGYPANWHYRTVDVVAIAAARLALPLPWPSTGRVLTQAGVPDPDPADRHTALGDANYARHAYWLTTYGLPPP